MDYVNFGSTGLKVSRLALGMGFRGQSDAAEAQRTVEHAISSGINLIDCANIYGFMDDRANSGTSETVLGKVLKQKRDKVVITSKVAGRMGPGPNEAGLSRLAIMSQVEHSLRRLNTDYIDVYLTHTVDESTPMDETIRALDDLVHSGKVRYLGCCNQAAWQVCKGLWIADKLNATPFVTVQNRYNLLDRSAEKELLGFVRDQGLGMMAYSPLGVGLLTGTYQPGQPAPTGSVWATHLRAQYEETMQERAQSAITTVHQLAAELGKTPAQLALAWVLSHPEITTAIIGADTVQHVEDNLGGLGWTLDPEIRAQLDAVTESLALSM